LPTNVSHIPPDWTPVLWSEDRKVMSSEMAKKRCRNEFSFVTRPCEWLACRVAHSVCVIRRTRRQTVREGESAYDDASLRQSGWVKCRRRQWHN
jgi:hypothetical protein